MKKIIKYKESEFTDLIKKLVIESSHEIYETEIPQTKDEILSFQKWVINTKKDKNILGKSGLSGFGDDGKWGPNTQKAWNKYKNQYLKNTSSKNKDKKNLKGSKTSIATIAKEFFQKFTNGKNPSSNSSLLFDGTTLQWISNGSSIKSWPATSGVNLYNAEPSQWLELIKKPFTSTQDLEKIKNFGPTPEGDYILGKLQSSGSEKTNPFVDFVKMVFSTSERSHNWNVNTAGTRFSWGYYRSAIIPKSGTKTYGRSSFYLHGGALPASHGCIDLTSNMDDFAKFYSSWTAKFKKNTIPLKVKYSSRLIDYLA